MGSITRTYVSSIQIPLKSRLFRARPVPAAKFNRYRYQGQIGKDLRDNHTTAKLVLSPCQ